MPLQCAIKSIIIIIEYITYYYYYCYHYFINTIQLSLHIIMTIFLYLIPFFVQLIYSCCRMPFSILIPTHIATNNISSSCMTVVTVIQLYVICCIITMSLPHSFLPAAIQVVKQANLMSVAHCRSMIMIIYLVHKNNDLYWKFKKKIVISEPSVLVVSGASEGGAVNTFSHSHVIQPTGSLTFHPANEAKIVLSSRIHFKQLRSFTNQTIGQYL